MLGTAGNVVRRHNPVGNTRFTRAIFASFIPRPLSSVAEEADLPSSSRKENAPTLRTKPKSLSLDHTSPVRVTDPPPTGWSGVALKLLGFYSRESQLIRGSRTLYTRISSQADTPELYTSFGLEKSFRTTHAMLLVYMWLTLVRLRAEGKEGSKVAQSLYEVFNHDLEKRIVAAGFFSEHAGVSHSFLLCLMDKLNFCSSRNVIASGLPAEGLYVPVKMLISKWMKQLERNFYGAVEAYDAAMQPTADKDALTRAFWRNVFSEDHSPMPTGADSASVKSFARYVRTEAACLAMTDSESLLTGNVLFSSDFGVLSAAKATDSERASSDRLSA